MTDTQELTRPSGQAPGLWDAADVAQHLGVKRGSVYSLAESGTIPHVRIGRLLRFRPSAIEEWLAAEERSQS